MFALLESNFISPLSRSAGLTKWTTDQSEARWQVVAEAAYVTGWRHYVALVMHAAQISRRTLDTLRKQ